MYSSEGLEKFYIDYQTEWMPRGMSIRAYCVRNNVPYKVLDKSIRDIYKRVVPVQVTGTLEKFKISVPSKRRQNQRKRRAMIISASRSSSVQVPAWYSLEMDWTIGASRLLSQNGGAAMLNITGMNKFTTSGTLRICAASTTESWQLSVIS